jgi:hypothetical protein
VRITVKSNFLHLGGRAAFRKCRNVTSAFKTMRDIKLLKKNTRDFEQGPQTKTKARLALPESCKALALFCGRSSCWGNQHIEQGHIVKIAQHPLVLTLAERQGQNNRKIRTSELTWGCGTIVLFSGITYLEMSSKP